MSRPGVKAQGALANAIALMKEEKQQESTKEIDAALLGAGNAAYWLGMHTVARGPEDKVDRDPDEEQELRDAAE